MIPSVTQVTSSCCTTSSSFTMNLDVHFFSRLISFSVYSPPRPAPSFLIAKYSLLGGFCALNTSPKALVLNPLWHSKPFSNSVHKHVIAYRFLPHFLDAVSLRLDDKLGVLAVVSPSTVWLSSVNAMLRCDVTLWCVHFWLWSVQNTCILYCRDDSRWVEKEEKGWVWQSPSLFPLLSHHRNTM